VEAAFFAASLRDNRLRRAAALRACFDNALREAAECGSRLSARSRATERL